LIVAISEEVEQVFVELDEAVRGGGVRSSQPPINVFVARIDSVDPVLRRAFAIEALHRLPTMREATDQNGGLSQWPRSPEATMYYWVCTILARLVHEDLSWTSDELDRFIVRMPKWMWGVESVHVRGQLHAWESRPRDDLTETAREFFAGLIDRELRVTKPDHSWIRRIRSLLGITASINLASGEVWADTAREWIAAREPRFDGPWSRMIEHCLRATSGAPSKKWLKDGRSLVEQTGKAAFVARVLEWFELADRPSLVPLETGNVNAVVSPYLIADSNMNALRGLCWLSAEISGGEELSRAMGQLAMSAFRRIPGRGPRAIKVGHAAIHALGRLPGQAALTALARLKLKVKFIPAQRVIDAAFAEVARREGVSREEIEELAVPGYGMSDVGVREEKLGEFTVRVCVRANNGVALEVVRADGSIAKSIPKAIKEQHAEELKELKGVAKDIATMLPAQRDRIDASYLENREWAFGVWRDRYLDHPLVGTVARRLIWDVADADGRVWTPVVWVEGQGLSRRDGASFEPQSMMCRARLWHPIRASVEDVVAWRRFIEERGIVQPFKQAHREVYLLTDAERNTRVYSNRFAAHVIKQHQFHALCGIRRWRDRLRLLVDAEFPPPQRDLPPWNLRAEYWVEGIGDQWGTDTNDAGAFLRLATDQVRFYRLPADAAIPPPRPDEDDRGTPVPVEDVPPLVFSEVMRDIDLFVGVSSIGNNPNWQDGGVDTRFRAYWWSYSFGELSATGETRGDVLSRLLPRLRIANRCVVTERFLLVSGKLRQYKIHLGSGNILMSPNDQYLCIVPTSGTRVDLSKIMLPFEGDNTLSIILSKAFLLVDDDKITDPTIVGQIRK